ncbi:hypothetical protein J6590_055121 [Homalodisca vitripennis]|nr:hypothetical protein J6590_055121 [Homalodisca vitripennis]
MAKRSKSLDFGSELEIAQVQILSVTVALFISTINLVLHRLSPLFCLISYTPQQKIAPRVFDGQQIITLMYELYLRLEGTG